jgi:DNA-binding response OmpR family regulator
MKSVLLVDDSAFVGTVLGDMLRELGIAVHVARDLWDLERWDGKPDLVLMDVVLQEAFGDDIASLFRVTRDWQAPVMLLSSLPDAELATRASEAGLDGFISKRIGFEAITERVRALLDAPSRRLPELGDVAFDVMARQRVRRVSHIAAHAEYWNAAGIIAELHALVGDAELIGETAIAELALAARVAVEAESAGPTRAVVAAIDVLARKLGVTTTHKTLLIVETGDYYRRSLLAPLDAADHLVLEARSLAEARQKLRAAHYDLILLDAEFERRDPSIRHEIDAHVPNAPIAVINDAEKTVEPARLVAQWERLMR